VTPPDLDADALPSPSSLFTDQLPNLRRTAKLGPLVDLACGRGRHALAAARAGLRCVAVDRNAGFLRELAPAAGRRPRLPLDPLRFDLERGLALPFADASCGAVLVFRFLYRPLAPFLERALAPGGWLLYETFTTGQLALGTGPTNRAFLLEPGELPRLFPKLEVIAYDEAPRGREVTARLVARRRR
jgi:SAM-dependent methyltransferase